MPRSTYTPAYKEFLELLIDTRRAAGITQVQLSLRLKKPQSFVSNVERGLRRVDIVEFCAIARALGADPEQLFRQLLETLPRRLVI